jgi:hypothetical protein
MSRTLISLRRVLVAALVSCGATCAPLLLGVSAQAQAAGSSGGTATQSAAEAECPNRDFRTGAGARLPDCRAYEMVSPVEKGGIGISVGCNTACQRAGLDQAALDGDELTYTSSGVFGDQQGAPYSSQYIASRGVDGWSNHGINAPRDLTIYGTYSLYDLNTQYDAFTEDLSTAWIHNDNATPLAPGGLHGVIDVYKRDNANDTYEALTDEEAMRPPAESLTEDMLVGHSVDGSHSVFLVPQGPLYDAVGGERKVVSLLPDGTSAAEPHLGGNFFRAEDWPGYGAASSEHAVSNDGSHIFWTNEGSSTSEGSIYARIDDSRTVLVAAKGVFRDASTDGTKALYDTGTHDGEGEYGNLYEFDVETQTTQLIAGKEFGMVGASDDLSYIYFVSQEALAPGGEAGKFNLYLDHEGVMTTVAVLSPQDVGLGGGFYNGEEDVASRWPIDRPARVTPDGRHIAFDSAASLTGYDNRDAVTGTLDIEVYAYDADSHVLSCVSCNPSGARPVGQFLPKPYTVIGETYGEQAAAWLPTSETSIYSSRPLSDDGTRVFFNSFDALVPRDGNSAQDVYEWEEQGAGSCERPGGCVNLISSGESPTPSEFIDADANGDDVFFTTESSLVTQDPGLVDLYDARMDGGFPAPPTQPAACEGEACQSAPVSPQDASPASASFSGPASTGAVGIASSKTMVAPKRKTAAQVRAQRLAQALKACRAKRRRSKRGVCEAAARKRYGVSVKGKAKKSTKGGK